jgi:hypothetical protein
MCEHLTVNVGGSASDIPPADPGREAPDAATPEGT